MALTINTKINNDADGYSLDASQVKGTYVVVADESERNSLPTSTRVAGTKVYQRDVRKEYRWDGTSWEDITANVEDILKVVPHTAALATNTSNTKVFLDKVNPSTEIFGSEYGTIFTHKRKWNAKLYDEGFNQLLNKADYPASKTETGITFMNNGDGTITVNGTASANTNFLLQTITLIKGHKYLLSDGVGKSRATYQTWAGLITGNVFLQTTTENNLAIATCAELADYTCYIRCRVQSGATVANITFKPQLIDLTYFENATGKTINTVEDFQKLYPDFYDYVPLPSPSTPLEIVPSGNKSNIVTKSVNMLRKEKYTTDVSGDATSILKNADGTVTCEFKYGTVENINFSLGTYRFVINHKYLILGGLSDVKPYSIRIGVSNTGYQDIGTGEVFTWSQNTQEKEVNIIIPRDIHSGTYTVRPMIVDLTEINELNITSKDTWLKKYAEYYEGSEKTTDIAYTAKDNEKQAIINNAISIDDVISERTKNNLSVKIKKYTFTGEEGWFPSGGNIFQSMGSGILAKVSAKVISNRYIAQNKGATSNYISVNSSTITIKDIRFSSYEDFAAHLAELYTAGTPLVMYYESASSENVIIEEVTGIPVIGGQPNIIESQDIGVTNAPVIMDFTNYVVNKLNKAYGLLKDNEGNLIVPYGQTNMLYDPNTDEYLSDLLPSKCNRIGKKDSNGTWYNNHYFENVSFTDIKRRQKIEVDVSDPLWEDTTAGTWGVGTLTIGNPGSGQATTSYYCIVSCSGISSDNGKLAYIVREVTPAKNPTTKSVMTTAADGTIVWEEYNSGGGSGTTVIANPTLTGGEADLTSLGVAGTNYKIPSSGGGGGSVSADSFTGADGVTITSENSKIKISGSGCVQHINPYGYTKAYVVDYTGWDTSMIIRAEGDNSANTLMQRKPDGSGEIVMPETPLDLSITNKKYVDDNFRKAITDAGTYVYTSATNNPNSKKGCTFTPIAGNIPQWNSTKCIKTETPTENDDCANKVYVDNSTALYIDTDLISGV